MAFELKIDMNEFRKALIPRLLALPGSPTPAMLRALHGRVQARTESQAEGDAVARAVSLALSAACEPRDEVNTGPVAVFLEDRITGVVTPK